jgi:CoA:oxalate CoA-transferase
MTRKALAGIRILDFTTTIAGPHCTRMLADNGAEVIKIESPDGGDMMRTRPAVRNGASAAFGQLNLGKKSIVLDLKKPAAVAVIKRLVAKADMLVENYRPGVMARLGLDYAALKPLKPDLIYCAISGYGQTGPSAGLPAYAPVIHAASGFDLAHLTYQEGRTKPDYAGVFFADWLSGTYAYGALMTALCHRQATGEGQMIDVSMLEGMLSIMLSELQKWQFTIPPVGRPMFGPLATRDGWINVAVASEKTFQDLCRAAGREDWITNSRFEKYNDRRLNWHLFITDLERWSTTLDSAAVKAALDARAVPCSLYRTPNEALEDPQLTHRGALVTAQDAGGSFKALNVPFRFSALEARATEGTRVASLGENTAEVLASSGFTTAEIATLREQGVIG